MIRSLLRALLAAFVVVLSVALVAPSAQAGPKQPLPQGGSDGTTNYSFTTTGKNGEKVLRAALVVQHSKDHKKRHLDWRAAKKYFDSHTTWRDDFAAGYLGGGGTLDNASKSTVSRLNKRWKNLGADAAKQAKVTPMDGTNCQGETKEVPYTSATGRSEAWYDSCATNEMIARWTFITSVLGCVTARTKGWAAAIPGLFALATGARVTDLVRAKSNSRYGAVKFIFTRVTRVGGNGLVDGQVYVSASVQSQ